MGNKETLKLAICGAALLLGGTIVGGSIIPRLNVDTTPTPVVTAPVYIALASGNATFTPKDGEVSNLTYTSTTRLGGWGLDRSWGETPSFAITWGDGATTGYRFFGDNVQVQELTSTGRGATYNGTWSAQSGDIIITSPTGAVTVLGQFEDVIDTERVRIFDIKVRLEAEEAAARQLQSRLDSESFDDMVKRLTDKVCVRAEGLQYINTRNVVAAANDVMTTFQIGSANLSRWNAMSGQLRFQRISSRMNWQCNNVAQLMHRNSLTDNINGLIILDSIFN